MANRSRALQTYHRQVREVVKQSGLSYADARRAVVLLREHDIHSAAATKRSKESVAAAVRILNREHRIDVEPREPIKGGKYKNLSEWIDVYDEWDGDYIEYDVETGVDY